MCQSLCDYEMGNCATKQKVLKDTEEDLVPVERDTTAPDHNKFPVKKSVSNAPSAADEAEAVAARRCEKGKEILIEDDVEEEHSKRQSLISLLFHEDKAIEKEITNLSRNKSGTSSEASKLDTSASNVKAPVTFDVQTRNDLEVKIPKDSEVKTPEKPKAKEAEDQEVNFSEFWDVKFPEVLEATKTSEVVKVAQASKLPQVTKEPDVPEVLKDENKNVMDVSEVLSPPELSQIKVKKESGVLEVLEDKNVTEVPKVITDKVEAAASELVKVSEVSTSEDLDIEVKTPETLSVGSERKTTEETKVSEFVDAQEKIDKSESHS